MKWCYFVNLVIERHTKQPVLCHCYLNSVFSVTNYAAIALWCFVSEPTDNSSAMRVSSMAAILFTMVLGAFCRPWRHSSFATVSPFINLLPDTVNVIALHS